MIVVIDNYDSFIYNIVQYIGEFYPDIRVFRNDAVTLDQVLAMGPDGIVISPGPGRPEDSRVAIDLLKNPNDIPLLGVCLGHQAIAYVNGGEIVGAKHIIHGKASTIRHNGKHLFEGVPSPFQAIRYHSLVAKRENLPDVLEVTAESDDGEIMGLKVKGRDVYGVQFHPESILTENGKTLIKNFVNLVVEKQQKKQTTRDSSRIKEILSKVSDRKDLSEDEAAEMMGFLMNGLITPSQTGGYLTALKMKGETVDEIAGSAKAMYAACVKIETGMDNLVDACGSGGDKSGTFNISTAASMVAAGAGVPMAKHGNRSITSKSGSADVLETLGINIQLSPEEAARAIREAGIGFVFAPLYHPGMKHAGPTRRELGYRTLFNILGPLVNPAGVKRHVMGVFSKELLDLIAPVFLKLGHVHSMVVHGEGGIDEAAIEGTTYYRTIRNGKVESGELKASDFGLGGKLDHLKVDSAEASAGLIQRILRGEEKGDPYKAVVLNAGLVIAVGLDLPFDEAFEKAKRTIEDGKALEVLERMRTVTPGRKE